MTDTLPIYEQTIAARYDRRDAIQRHPEEPPVNLLEDIRTEFSKAVAWGEDEFRSAFPTVARLADDADAVANSAAAKAVLGAVLSPADEAIIVGLVNRLDQSAHAAEAAVDLQPADAAPEPADPPADPAPGPVDAGPVGPFVGGQAQ